MPHNEKNGPRVESNGPSQVFESRPNPTPEQPVYVPVCYSGTTPRCGQVGYCHARKQLMCGGHVAANRDSDEALFYALDNAIERARLREESFWEDFVWSAGHADDWGYYPPQSSGGTDADA